ncbi:MAG: hypothetical protein JW797_13785 [Bradymonadales bacterium]|nr:hypothetical protein [Bradymonadales bacterium]
MSESDGTQGNPDRWARQFAQIRQRTLAGEQNAAIRELQSLLEEVERTSMVSAQRQEGAFRQLQAALHGELGLVFSTLGSLDQAEEHLAKACELSRPQDGEGSLQRVMAYVTSLLNWGSITAARGDASQAQQLWGEALERLHGLAQQETLGPADRRVWEALLRNRARTRELGGDLEGAIRDLEQALDCLQRLTDGATDAVLADEVLLSLDLVRLHRTAGQTDRAFQVVEGALAAAQRAVDREVGPYVALYVQAKLAMADCCVLTGQFAQAEDHLFQVVEAVPEWMVPVLVAIDQYVAMLAMNDEVLRRGGLPRGEVEEGFAELLAILDARFQDEQISELARARYRLLVNGEREPAERLLEEREWEELDGDPGDERSSWIRNLELALSESLRTTGRLSRKRG